MRRHTMKIAYGNFHNVKRGGDYKIYHDDTSEASI